LCFSHAVEVEGQCLSCSLLVEDKENHAPVSFSGAVGDAVGMAAHHSEFLLWKECCDFGMS
jgi:hypothetical protein